MSFHRLTPPTHPTSAGRPSRTNMGRHVLLWGIALILGIALIASARSVPVEAAATTTPRLQVSPTVFMANTACPFSGGFFNCRVRLSEAAGFKSQLHWSVNWTGGINFFAIITPDHGTLSPGQSIEVTIAVNWDGCPSSSNGTNGLITFTGPANSVKVHWSCRVNPTLLLSPSQFNANTDCSFIAGKGWTCIETLGSNQFQQAWSARSDTPGVTFQPASGIVSIGQKVKVTIFVPATTCPATATFTFLNSINNFEIPWSC